MAQPLAGRVTISSVGVSPALMVDPTARVTNAFVATPSTTADITLQVTLDVPMSQGGLVTALTWANVSSIHVAYSAGNEGASYSFLGPIAGLRLASSAMSSLGTTLEVLQEIIA